MASAETGIISGSLGSPRQQISLLEAAILNGHKFRGDSSYRGNAGNSLSYGESMLNSALKARQRVGSAMAGSRENGHALDMSLKMADTYSDEEGSSNSKDESKDETNPSSPATGSVDGDASISPESLEQLAMTQEPTLIVNGFDIYYKCKLCFKVFSTEQRWKRHKQDTHFNPRLHVCPICGERFKRSTHLKRHQDRRHAPQSVMEVVTTSPDKRRFSCSQCPRVFERSNKLLAHIQQYHQNKRPYRCETCNEGFKRQDHLNRHRESKSHKLRLVLANKPECGEDVINCGDVPKEMMRSFASHTGYRSQALMSLVQNGRLRTRKPVPSNHGHVGRPADVLDARNGHSSALRSSLVESSSREVTSPDAHTTKQASISDASFGSSVSPESDPSSASSLLKHLNGLASSAASMEASEEPPSGVESSNVAMETDSDISALPGPDGGVTCVLCGKCFESEKRMKIHLRQTHSSERRHVCRLCGERFKRSTHLRRHLNSNKHQRLSHAHPALSGLGSMEDLEDEEYLQMNGGDGYQPYSTSTRGHHQFPAGLYLNDYDDVPISMVPRSLPMQLYRNDSDDDDSEEKIAMETKENSKVMETEPNNNKSSYLDNHDTEDAQLTSTPRKSLKPRGMVSLLNPRHISPVKTCEGEDHIQVEKDGHLGAKSEDSSEDNPKSTLRSLLQNSQSPFNHNNNNNMAAFPGAVRSGDSEEPSDLSVICEDSDASQFILDMSHLYQTKPWECSLCHHFFETRHNVQNHVRKVHSSRLYHCALCPKSYKARTDLHKHCLKIHRDSAHVGLTPDSDAGAETPKPVSRRKKTMPRKVLFHIETDKDEEGAKETSEKSDLDTDVMETEDDLDPGIDLDEIMSQADRDRSLSPPAAIDSVEDLEELEAAAYAFVKRNTINNRTNFECRICNKAFSARPNVHTHIRQIHQNLRPFGCQFCGETFKRGTHLRLHISRRHYEHVINEGMPLETDEEDTPQVLYQKPSRNLHNSLHPNSSKIWNCARCPKSFPKRDLYEHHMKLHMAAEKCACPFCDQVFTREADLKQHLRAHEDEPRFVCALCSVSFLLKSAYDSHMKEHEESSIENPDDGEELYDAEDDDSASLPDLSSSGDQLRWKRNFSETVDSAEKRQKVMRVTDPNVVKEVIIKLETRCAVCGEVFENMDSLRAHTRAHRKPYCCQFCSKKYDNISYLERHTRVHTGSKPYICSVCSRGFPRKERAEEHIVKYH